jgi:hypothetical protein
MSVVVKFPKFSSISSEDPSEWLSDFWSTGKANSWNDERMKNIFGVYLKKEAREWYIEWYDNHDDAGWATTVQTFLTKYCDEDFKEQ